MRKVALYLGAHRFVCATALSSQEQQRGLCEYGELRAREGMLFPFPLARAARFAMKSVAFPIDILFVEEGRVAQVVHSAQPKSSDSWGHSPTSAVVEVAGGTCAALGISPGTRVAYGFVPAEEPSENMGADRYTNVGTPDDVVQTEADPEHWDSQWGYDQSKPGLTAPTRMGQRLESPADLIVGIVKAMMYETDPLQWTQDILKHDLQYAVIDLNTVADWLSNFDMPAQEQAIVLETVSLDLLADAFILLGLADSADIKDDKLILWAHNG